MTFYRICLTLLLATGVWLLTHCRKDRFITAGGAGLGFSTDTLAFDTVFTSRGSATRFFKIYNPHNRKLKVSRIMLAGGDKSAFRMNVDGLSTTDGNDYELLPGDSLYIFVEVTVNPNTQNNPFVIYDSILFRANDRRQRVILSAWGQNAHFHDGEVVCGETWTADKPHVIVNSLLVDSNCTLTIQEGVQVYCHRNSRFFVHGTLKVFGQGGSPVVFQGDRLEHFYRNKPGQWEGIHLLRGSINNEIHHTVIQNGIVGIRVDSLPENTNPNLFLNQTVLRHHLSAGLLALTAIVQVQNCLFYHCGDHAVQLELGGLYSFTHCTFAGYGSSVLDHKKPALRASNYLETQILLLAALDARFVNCIIYGSQEEETGLDRHEEVDYDLVFDHCLIRTEEEVGHASYESVILNENPLFKATVYNEADFRLESGSPAIDAGKSTPINVDIEGNPRSDPPDIGAYEQ